MPQYGAARAAACVTCHGSPGRPPLAGNPSLDGQLAQYLELQLVLMREGLRGVPQMAGMLKGLSDRDLGDLAAALTAYRDNRRTGIDTSMNGVMYQVTDGDIRALAHYLAHH